MAGLSRAMGYLLTGSAVLAILAGSWWHPAGATSAAQGPIKRRSKEKFLQLNYFVHDDLNVPNASAYFIVPPLDGKIPTFFLGNTFFGGVVAFDDLITAGPERDSLAIGRAKGIYVWDSQDLNAVTTELIVTAVFNEASGFPGSTLSYQGVNPITGTTGGAAPLREVAITGGTSHFRLARGWVEFRLYSVSGNNYAAVVNFTASIYYGGY